MRRASITALVVAIPLTAAHGAPIEILKGAAPSNAAQVKIEATQFTDGEVKVKTGSTVAWTNTDGATHNIHFRRGPAKGDPNAQGRMLNQGDVYVVKFDQPGQYEYIDTLHSTMKGKVVVE